MCSSMLTLVSRKWEGLGEGLEGMRQDCCFVAGIGLFEVDQKDHVRKYNDADALTVFKYRTVIEGQPPAFLQCGGFMYPLIPGKSPILKSGDHMYMFPELRGEGEGSGFVNEGSEFI